MLTFLLLASCWSRFCLRSWMPSSSRRLRSSCESRLAFLYIDLKLDPVEDFSPLAPPAPELVDMLALH